MPQSNRHRIQRQLIELRLIAESSGPRIQESIARTFREQLLPALAQVFDRQVNAHEMLRLDRLEIDLGSITSEDWEQEFQQRAVAEVTRHLERYTPAPVERGEAANDDWQGDALAQWLFFLVHGCLPWWGARPPDGWSAVAKGALDSESPALRQTLCANLHARARLVDVLDDETLGIAVESWTGVAQAARVVEILVPERMAPAVRARLRRRQWMAILDWALDDGGRVECRIALARELLQIWREMVSSSAAESTAESADRSAVQVQRIPEAEAATQSLPRPWIEWLSAATHPGVDAKREEPPRVPRADARGDEARPMPPAPARRPAESGPPVDEDPIYLPCAGVILLHPFLETLFHDRDLLEGRDLRDAAARERAVRLVGLLGFGEVDVPEYDLVIAKLLCGHPLEAPLGPELPGAEDAAACDEVLGAVLKHWSALRSSSVAWLRTQFFLRDGKLERVDEGYRLTVEHRAQDVLLARLPWGLGVISLPWQKEHTFVHWLD